LHRRIVANEDIPPGHLVEQSFCPGEALTPGWGHSLFSGGPFDSALSKEHPLSHHDNADKLHAGMQRVEQVIRVVDVINVTVVARIELQCSQHQIVSWMPPSWAC
jgi:hypothetical protein